MRSILEIIKILGFQDTAKKLIGLSERDASISEVVGSWLIREYNNNWNKYIEPYVRRFLPDISKEYLNKVVLHPNYSSKEENILRFMLLYNWRNPLLFPCWNATWHCRAITEEEFKELRVIKASGWIEISVNSSGMASGRLSDVAENVFKNIDINFNNKEAQDNYDETRKNLRKWEDNIEYKDINSTLILLKTNNSAFTILEGNKSALALFIKTYLKHEFQYNPITIFYGRLEKKCLWQW